jgi:hypothetical protein
MQDIFDNELNDEIILDKKFPDFYSEKLNETINKRYQEKGFLVNYVVFDNSFVSPIIKLNGNERILKAGIDYETHKNYVYPNPDIVLNKLGEVEKLVVGGFHMWDCVERFAKRAYEKEFDVLVDEDLTEFFTRRIQDPDFNVESYPNYDPKKLSSFMLDAFIKSRENRPWLLQEY